MKTKKHNYIHLDNNTMNFPKDWVMSQGDLTILHNLCVDVLNEHPQMIGIERIKEQLELVLELPCVGEDWEHPGQMDEDF